MILIADCGSTKIDWCVADYSVSNNPIVKRFETCGMNAVLLTPEEMRERISQEMLPQLDTDLANKITDVYFYGAGCISPAVCGNVADAIRHSLPNAKVEVATDLLGAARALCGRRRGVACILGTGSNSCYYDGEKIARNVSPLGYILGDEGSGAVLGKLLVGNVLKGQLPDDLCEAFLKQYDLDNLSIIDRVYRKPQPNRFLASLSPFIKQNIDRPEMHQMAVEAFRAFFKRNLDNYKTEAPEGCKANFIGSIAHHYRDVLSEAAKDSGWEIGIIEKSPMDGLIEYHRNF
ncbi:MAG: ATPase [Bacteroidales bacterium]|nr:ATPase [Bacteroidales bacterium]